MWVIYHGYHAVSTPLLAAILHRHVYPPLDNDFSAAALPSRNCINCTEGFIYHLWKQAICNRYFKGLTFYGLDTYGNEIYVLGRGRFFTILERTVHSAMELTGSQEQLLFVDTSDCTNFYMELGIWLRQQFSVLSTFHKRDDHNRYLGTFIIDNILIERGVRQSFPKLAELVYALGDQLC